jgi:hypothetical protein
VSDYTVERDVKFETVDEPDDTHESPFYIGERHATSLPQQTEAELRVALGSKACDVIEQTFADMAITPRD